MIMFRDRPRPRPSCAKWCLAVISHCERAWVIVVHTSRKKGTFCLQLAKINFAHEQTTGTAGLQPLVLSSLPNQYSPQFSRLILFPRRRLGVEQKAALVLAIATSKILQSDGEQYQGLLFSNLHKVKKETATVKRFIVKSKVVDRQNMCELWPFAHFRWVTHIQ